MRNRDCCLMQRFAVPRVRTEQLREAFSPLRTSIAANLLLPEDRSTRLPPIESSVFALAPPCDRCVCRLRQAIQLNQRLASRRCELRVVRSDSLRPLKNGVLTNFLPPASGVQYFR